jgi:hypothetical protein
LEEAQVARTGQKREPWVSSPSLLYTVEPLIEKTFAVLREIPAFEEGKGGAKTFY